MVSADADANADPVPCDFCDLKRAVVFCRADSARLCLACDREVHAANTVSFRHNRSLLCDSCASAPATIFCPTPPHRLVLCSSCDFNAHQADDHRHDRRAIDPFTGCPTGAVLAAALGLGDDKGSLPNKVEEDSDWAWEVPQVFSWDDLILQPTTTPFHGFQAMGIPPPPKDKISSCGKREDEIHRQIRKLIISETDGVDYSEENVPVMECKSLQLENLQLGKFDNEYGHATIFVEIPSCEVPMVGRKVEVLEGEIKQLKIEISDLHAQLLDVKSQISAIHEKMDGNFFSLGEMLKKLLEGQFKTASSETREASNNPGSRENSKPIRQREDQGVET
ncbi:hypothetical protein M5K25_027456 [Dendrobium thyrsiflorum]|uniref:B box-type domain-containing protein n=1 Tax=Dendrobium thyrsiflorum TaxID=117978 RepID=A0ABD0U017_DENTH